MCFAVSRTIATRRTKATELDLESWLRVTEASLPRITRLEKVYGSVAGATELRDAVTRARARLADWQPPRLSMSVGLSDMTLTPEGAAELDLILEEARRNPPRRIESRVQVKDASFLKNAVPDKAPS